MGRGLSLHVGLNHVDPSHYAGWSGPLTACEFDAQDMQLLAAAAGFETRTLLTKAATRAAVVAAFEMAVNTLGKGDMFLWTASCHGGQLPDRDGEERDLLDETLCLFDGEWLDDETERWLTRFARGVRMVTVQDACHTGTSYRAIRERGMPTAVAAATYAENRRFYEDLRRELTQGDRQKLEAALVALGACRDDQTAADGATNGRFTAALKSVWRQGRFVGDYHDLHGDILRRMPTTQVPTLTVEGPLSDLLGAQEPFSIEGISAMPQKSKQDSGGWSNEAAAGTSTIAWGRSQPGTARPAPGATRELVQLLDGEYATSAKAPSTLYVIRDGRRDVVSPQDAVAAGVTQADIRQVDAILLAGYPLNAERGRDQTFHWWSDLDAGHTMESWAWFPPGKVAVRTITQSHTLFGGFTGGMTAMLVGTNGEAFPEVEVRATFGVDGTAFGSGVRDETYEWDVPQHLFDRVDSVTIIHCWEPRVDVVAEVVKWVKFIWEIYRELSKEEGVSLGSETV